MFGGPGRGGRGRQIETELNSIAADLKKDLPTGSKVRKIKQNGLS